MVEEEEEEEEEGEEEGGEQQAQALEKTPEPELQGPGDSSYANEKADDETTPAPSAALHSEEEAGEREEQQQLEQNEAFAAQTSREPAADLPSRSRSLEQQASKERKQGSGRMDTTGTPPHTVHEDSDDTSAASKVPSYLRPTSSFRAHTGKLVSLRLGLYIVRPAHFAGVWEFGVSGV